MSNKSFASRPFEKLKKQIERTQGLSSPPPPRKKKKEAYTDEELFSTAMDDVQEIAAFRALSCVQHHPKETVSSERRHPDDEVLAILDEIAGGQRPIHLPDTQEYVEWTNPAYHGTISTKLHHGHFAVQAFLDLHGFTVTEAEAEMEAFLREAFIKGWSCVKIIHGRGLRSVKGPRVKDAVLRRLLGHYRHDIIAYVSARQCDGGLGALYVLLRKK
jgi:DNA-nicking Smr family endonuclease